MSESEVRRRLVGYFTGQCSLRELDSYLTSIVWEQRSLEDARALANLIELRIDEYSAGTCTEEELKAALLPLVTDYTTSVVIGAPSNPANVRVSTAGSSTVAPVIGIPQLADTRLVAASW